MLFAGLKPSREGSMLRAGGVAAIFLISAFIIGGLVYAAYSGYSRAILEENGEQQEQDTAQLIYLIDRGIAPALALESESLSAPHGMFMLLGADGAVLAEAASRENVQTRKEIAAQATAKLSEFPTAPHTRMRREEFDVGEERYLATIASHRRGQGEVYSIVFASPESLLLAPARETLRLLATIGVAVLAFFTLLSWLTAYWISAPIVAINKAVAGLSVGNLNVAVPVRRVGELGILTRHFNRMVAIIRESMASLAESEKKKQAILDALPDLIFVNSRDGTYLDYHVNDPSRLAMAPEKFMGRKIAEIFPSEFAEHWLRLVRDAVDTRRMQHYEYDLKVGGRVRRFESRTVPYGNDAALTVSRDITELRASERTMLHLVSAVEQAADSIIITDADGTVTYVNPSFTRITGVKAEDALGSPFPLAGGEKTSPSFEQWRKIPAQHRPSWQGRLINTFGGREVVGQVSISPIRDMAGSVIGYVSAQRDMTRETELEASVSQARRLEALGRLAGGISHDFNNLLVAISGYTDLGLRRNADPQVGEDLLAVKRAASRARDLVRQIMAFGRIGYREERPLRPGAVLEEVMSLMKPTIPPDIETILAAAEDPVVLADPTDLHRVFTNLVSNAVQAMRHGGGVLYLGVDRFELGEEFCSVYTDLAPGLHCRVTIADTGHGMSPEVLERAFEPFYSKRGKGEAPSTGMGLAVAHGLITAMKGAITAKSKQGEGATFEIYLPLADREEDEGIDPDETPVEGSERILFVDDDEQVMELAARALPRYGYKITTARSAEEALALFAKNPGGFDAVVADFHMGGMDGVEMACKMMTSKPGLPVVIITGQGNRDTALAAKARGVSEYVLKPVSMEYVTILIRRACDGARKPEHPNV